MEQESITVLGRVNIEFGEQISYEPPPYVFGDVLPPPQGDDQQQATTVSEPTAEAIRVDRSGWKLSELRLASDTASQAKVSDSQTAEYAVANLVHSGRLPFAPNSDPESVFTSAALVEQLLALGRGSQGLTDEEKKALLTPQFVHYLAWQRVQDINASSKRRLEAPVEASLFSAANAKATSGAPSASPWEEQDGSIAASDENAEKNSKLLSLLSETVGQCWRSQRSVGAQTHMHTPGVNSTLPYANPEALKDSSFAVPPQAARESVATCRISNLHRKDASKTVQLCVGENHFGRSGAATPAGQPATPLESFSEHPKALSPHHFVIFVEKKRNSDGTDDGELRYSLVNYGRNGVRVVGAKRWVLGEVLPLESSSEIIVSDVSLTLNPQEEQDDS